MSTISTMASLIIPHTTAAAGAPPVDTEESDAAILRRVRRGDEAAFELLVRRYQNRVFGILSRYERDAHKVEDLAQDTFLKAWRGLAQYSGKSPFEHWLSRIASNVARDHLRRIQRRIRETSFEDLGDGSLDWLSAGNTNRQLQVHEAGQLLEYAMQALTPENRLVVTMREIEGRSWKEVGELTGQAPGSAKVRCHRAKAKMREVLQQLFKREAADRAATRRNFDWQSFLETLPQAA